MLRQMQAREEAAWFEHPVSLVDVPDYLALISHPMDYSTMGKKLAEGEYSASLRSFASDMRLIFRNALTYNWNAENQYHRAAKQVCSPQRVYSLSKPEHASANHNARRQPSLCARAGPIPPVLPCLRSAHDHAPHGRRP